MALKTTRHAGLLCTALSTAMLSAASASAADGIGGSAAVASDYQFRGVSRTRDNPALQAGVDWRSSSGWNAGMWASTVSFDEGLGPKYEIDLHIGRAWALNPDWSAHVVWTHYYYPDDSGFDYDYDELSASLSFQQRVTATIAWSPNTTLFGYDRIVRDKPAAAYELAVMQPVASRLSLVAGAGYYDLHQLFGVGYWYWSAGLVFSFNALQLDFMRIGTDEKAQHLFEYAAGRGQWTAALSWRF